MPQKDKLIDEYEAKIADKEKELSCIPVAGGERASNKNKASD